MPEEYPYDPVGDIILVYINIECCETQEIATIYC
jgi:hypothetical protein